MNGAEIGQWRAAVSDMLADLCPLERVRRLRDGDGPGWDPATWDQIVEIGLPFVHLPVSLGGGGGDLTAAAVVMEACGRRLVPEPITSSFVASTLLARGGGPTDIDLSKPGTRWTLGIPLEPGFAVLDPDGASAVVLATDHDVRLVAPDHDTRRGVLIDGRRVAHMASFDRETTLACDGVTEATIGVAAELLGVAGAAIDLTIEYLKARKQFGNTLSTFQALRHRIARLVIDRALVRAVLTAAINTPSPLLAAASKARAGALALDACRQGIQLHGGIGMTDEADIGLFYKRACVLDQVLGDAAFQRVEFGRLLSMKTAA
jgi:alkylation response protein AidB-like acyl-CoA dehydrogenase